MSLSRVAALRGWRSFEGAGIVTRAFLLARLSIIPLGAMDTELRGLRGRVLSVGCGHGVVERYLAEINPNVEIVGAELDAERVDLASQSAHRYPNLTIRNADARELAESADFDAVLAVDVFHHIPLGDRAVVAHTMAAAVREGGMCLVKEMDVRPAWKYHWNRLHDRIVSGEWIECLSPGDMAALFEEAGLAVERAERVDRPYGPYPQYVLRLIKPGRGDHDRAASSSTAIATP